MVDLSPPDCPDISCRAPPDFAWPGGKTCGVLISWHVDGEAGPVGWDRDAAQHVTAMSEAAYGVTTALPRILALHRDAGIPATFFVQAHAAERHPRMIEAILADGHEIAHHGYIHEDLSGLPADEQRRIFEHASAILERMTGRAPRGWSAPGWGVDGQTLGVMASLGLSYDVSLMEYDIPHIVNTGTGDLVELPVSMVLDDWPLFGASLHPSGGGVTAPTEEARRIWQEEFEGLRRYAGLFHTTFHPNLMGRPGRLNMLEQLFDDMRSFGDVWWGTCDQAAAHVRALDSGSRKGMG